MVINRRRLDAAEIREQHGGIVRVAVGDGLRIQAPEIQPADDPDRGHEQDPWDLRKTVDHRVDAAGGGLTLTGLADFAGDLVAHGVKRLVFLRDEEHQGLFAVVLKAALADEAEADVIVLVHPSALNEVVHLRTLLEHAGNRHDERVEHGGLVVGMGGVFRVQIGQQFRHVETVFHENLGIGAVGHQVPHDGLQTGHIPYPARVTAVAPAAFRLCIGHMSILPDQSFKILKGLYPISVKNTSPKA